MFKKMIKDKIYCGLDVGSQKIKAAVVKCGDNHRLDLLGVYEDKTFGYKDCSVTNLGELSECIFRTVHELSQRTNVKIKNVNLGVSGELVQTRETDSVIPLVDRGQKVIVQRDINKINEQTKLLSAKMEEEILHHLPQTYKVDDINSALNPLGLLGRKLSVHSIVVLTEEMRIKNLTKAVHEAGFNVSNVFFSSLASCESIFSQEDKTQGCALLDIGARRSALLVFKDNILQGIRKIDIGGNNFTNQIAKRLALPFDLAEEIKKSYADTIYQEEYSNEEILVKRESEYIPIKRDAIFQAIEPEVKRFVEAIRNELDSFNEDAQLQCGLKLIGGGALLTGFIERVGREAGLAVQLGKVRLKFSKNLSHAAVFAPVIGLAQSGHKSSFSFSSTDNEDDGWMQHLSHRVRELYQEYF